MAITVSLTRRSRFRRDQLISGFFTVSGDYVQGTGETLTASALSLSAISNITFGMQLVPGGYVPVAVPGSAIANLTSVKVLFYFGDSDGVADGPLVEIPGAPTAYPAGLSGATYWFMAHGRD